MMNINAVVNQPVRIYFTTLTGVTDFGGMRLFNDGVLVVPTGVTTTETVQPGMYTSVFTPTATGKYALFYLDTIIAYIEVSSRSVFSFLKNIEDEALGSWSWNKQTGKLSMIRQDGTPLGEYDVVDTLTNSSREKLN